MAGERYFRAGATIYVIPADTDAVVPDGAEELDPVRGEAEVVRLTGVPIELLGGGS